MPYRAGRFLDGSVQRLLAVISTRHLSIGECYNRVVHLALLRRSTMTSHTIQLSEKTYALLLKQAARLQTTPEDVIERVLANDLTLLTGEIGQDKPAATAEALAAVQRLTSL